VLDRHHCYLEILIEGIMPINVISLVALTFHFKPSEARRDHFHKDSRLSCRLVTRAMASDFVESVCEDIASHLNPIYPINLVSVVLLRRFPSSNPRPRWSSPYFRISWAIQWDHRRISLDGCVNFERCKSRKDSELFERRRNIVFLTDVPDTMWKIFCEAAWSSGTVATVTIARLVQFAIL